MLINLLKAQLLDLESYAEDLDKSTQYREGKADGINFAIIKIREALKAMQEEF